ncbi:MAG: orotate phosphoribosyltransferase [Chloroflexi bacterium]|nr:orotate phosphoribosyltransferase [Chloroflexota bacterium]
MGEAASEMTLEGLTGSAARRGHFLLESGHHGDLWLDLELLCLHPRQVERCAASLAEQLRRLAVEAVCGPLNEGTFVALLVASRLDVEFSYAERFERPGSDELFPVEYRLPGSLRASVRGRRVAIVNDVINAGSAVRGTHADLLACGAEPVALASLLVLGESAARFAREKTIPLISLGHYPTRIWTPEECPLCAVGASLDRP